MVGQRIAGRRGTLPARPAQARGIPGPTWRPPRRACGAAPIGRRGENGGDTGHLAHSRRTTFWRRKKPTKLNAPDDTGETWRLLGGGVKFHFISGLPRSGSTLLAAILRQNPRFHAGISSPVAGWFGQIVGSCSAGSEFASLVDQAARERVLRGLFGSYYAEQAADSVVFDSNRAWCARLPDLARLFPDGKVIACVRNVAWVLDSLERLYRASAFENTRLFNDDVERNTVYSRVDTLAQRNRLVGFAWAACKDAYYGEHAERLLLVDYDLLVAAPAKVIDLVYRFLDEPPFEHDFERIAFDAVEFDQSLGLSGLHRVRPRVAAEPRRTVLPPDLFEQYATLSFWHDPAGSAAHVIRLKP